LRLFLKIIVLVSLLVVAADVSRSQSTKPPTSNEDDIPVLIKHLPPPEEAQKNAVYLDSFSDLEKLGLQHPVLSAVESGGDADAALATYAPSKVLIIEFHTPQAATFGHNAVQQTASDKRIVKRTGNYVVVADGFTNREAAQAIVDKVKYTVQIHWEGKKFTSIPIDFRPPDPAALEEAAETATVILRTFYGIGVLLLCTIVVGVFTGWTIFYWRRYRRRRLGLENMFSDAGGTLLLDLDEKRKLIGSGEV